MKNICNRRSLLRGLIVCVLATISAMAQTSATAPNTTPNASAKDAKTPEEIESDKLNVQVVQLFKEKKFNDALPLAKRTVELREQALGLAHERTVIALKNLAAVYTELGNHRETVGVRQRVLQAEEKLHGQASVKLSDNLSKLGWARARADDFGAAEDAFKRNLQIQEAAYGADAKELAAPLNDLAMVSQHAGKLGQSVGYFKRLIALKEKMAGEPQLGFAELLVKAAIVLRRAGKKTEAEEYETRAQAIYAASVKAADAPPPTVPAGVLTGYALLKVQPGYPAAAKQSRTQGSVQVQVVIDELGIVTKATAISGPNELRKDSEAAAWQWRFKPSVVEGRAVKVQGILTFNFTLQ